MKGKIRANDQNIKELVEKISYMLHNEQADLSDIAAKERMANGSNDDQSKTVHSLEYYMNITSDFTKIIRSLSKGQQVSKERLQEIMRGLDSEGDLSRVCFELFKRYVVYDAGTVRQDIQDFISSCITPLMTQSELK